MELESFLTAIELVETVATSPAAKAVCIKFVRAKLDGRALEYLPEEVDTIQDISTALRHNIKPESSKVVEGKLLALRVEKNNFTKFNEQAEKLAESFRRSLVIECISKRKAQDMTVRKTVELCRKTARSEIVKSVLARSQFEQPADVLSKLIIEVDLVKKENRGEAETNNRNQNSNRRNSNLRRGNYWNRGRGNYNNRGQNQNNQNQNKNHGQNNHYHCGGRGNYRGNQNQNQNRGYQGNRKEHTIRIVTGDAQPGTSAEQQQGAQRNEQVFRVAPN